MLMGSLSKIHLLNGILDGLDVVIPLWSYCFYFFQLS